MPCASHPANIARSFQSTNSTFQLDAIVSAAAERFRGSRYGSSYDLRDVVRVANEASEALPQTDEVHGFLDLLTEAARLER